MSATERLEVRVTPAAKSLVAEAADLVNEPVSEFVRSAVESRAQTVLQTYRETRVPSSYFDDLLAALREPNDTNETLREAARHVRHNVKIV